MGGALSPSPALRSSEPPISFCLLLWAFDQIRSLVGFWQLLHTLIYSMVMKLSMMFQQVLSKVMYFHCPTLDSLTDFVT